MREQEYKQYKTTSRLFGGQIFSLNLARASDDPFIHWSPPWFRAWAMEAITWYCLMSKKMKARHALRLAFSWAEWRPARRWRWLNRGRHRLEYGEHLHLLKRPLYQHPVANQHNILKKSIHSVWYHLDFISSNSKHALFLNLHKASTKLQLPPHEYCFYQDNKT
jgi:hypothetical protein